MAASLTDFTNLSLTGSWGQVAEGPPASERIGPGPWPKFFALDEWPALVRAVQALTPYWRNMVTNDDPAYAEPNHRLVGLTFGPDSTFSNQRDEWRVYVDTNLQFLIQVNLGTDAIPNWQTCITCEIDRDIVTYRDFTSGRNIFVGGGVWGASNLDMTTLGNKIILDADDDTYITASADDKPKLYIGGVEGHMPASSATTGGSGSAGAGNQYIELQVDGVIYKVLHDGTV